ncbi:hypothetical protein BH11ARM2_BH11ARM2_32750 [soil metagenome]
MAQEFTESTPLETLYEEAYQAELAVWNDRHRAWGLFFSPGGPYSIGVACDVFLVWFPLAVIIAAELNALFREPIFLLAVPFLTITAGFAFANLRERDPENAWMGPFGWWTHRKFLTDGAERAPQRFDPWSTEAIRKSVCHIRQKLRSGQEATLGRVWDAKVASGNALHAAREMRTRLSGLANGSLLQAARLHAIDRLISRHETIARDLDEQETVANRSPQPVLAYLDNLEAELA